MDVSLDQYPLLQEVAERHIPLPYDADIERYADTTFEQWLARDPEFGELWREALALNIEAAGLKRYLVVTGIALREQHQRTESIIQGENQAVTRKLREAFEALAARQLLKALLGKEPARLEAVEKTAAASPWQTPESEWEARARALDSFKQIVVPATKEQTRALLADFMPEETPESRKTLDEVIDIFLNPIADADFSARPEQYRGRISVSQKIPIEGRLGQEIATIAEQLARDTGSPIRVLTEACNRMAVWLREHGMPICIANLTLGNVNGLHFPPEVAERLGLDPEGEKAQRIEERASVMPTLYARIDQNLKGYEVSARGWEAGRNRLADTLGFFGMEFVKEKTAIVGGGSQGLDQAYRIAQSFITDYTSESTVLAERIGNYQIGEIGTISEQQQLQLERLQREREDEEGITVRCLFHDPAFRMPVGIGDSLKGVKIEEIETTAETGFHLTAAVVQAWMDQDPGKNRMISIVPRNNPPSRSIDLMELAKILAVVKSRNGVIVVDWAYLGTGNYAQDKKIGELFAASGANCIYINPITKSMGRPGTRAGLLAASNEDLAQYVEKHAKADELSKAEAMQRDVWATIDYVSLYDQAYLSALYSARQDRLLQIFKEVNSQVEGTLFDIGTKPELEPIGRTGTEPDGALYVWVALGKKGTPDSPIEYYSYQDVIRNTGLFCVPDIAFIKSGIKSEGGAPMVRFAVGVQYFGIDTETIHRIMKEEILNGLNGDDLRAMRATRRDLLAIGYTPDELHDLGFV